MRKLVAFTVLAVSLFVGLLPSQITIANPSSRNYSSWVPLPVPYEDAAALPERCLFNGRTAIRGTVVGKHTVFYDTRLDLEPNESVTGDVIADDSNPGEYRFQATNWVLDNLHALVPVFNVVVGNQIYSSNNNQTLRFVKETGAHQLWKVNARAGPFVFWFWITIYSGQDVVEWELMAVHSDPESKKMMVSPTRISMQILETPIVDYHPGVKTTWDVDRSIWVVDLLSQRTDFGDGQGLPLISGALLCTDGSRPLLQTLLSKDPADQARVDSLLSRVSGRALVTRDWSNRWLAFQATVPRHPQDKAQLDSRFNKDWRDLTTQKIFDDPWRGLHKNAGSTGSQFDFGASKGAEFTMGDARFFFVWRWQLDEMRRPIHYRESDGSRVSQADNHPNWWTWSQKTHWHCGSSPDRLGKPCPEPAHNTHGWNGKDDQHKSSNGLHAFIASVDSPAARAVLWDEIELSYSNIRLQNNATGAPRAIGRRLLADSNAWLLTGDDEVWNTLVVRHSKNAWNKSAGKNKPESVYRIQSSMTDSRAMVDPTTGKPVACVVVWEHGLELLGISAAWNTARLRGGTPPPELGKLYAMLATTFAKHFFRKDGNGKWYTFHQIRYLQGGTPIPEQYMVTGAQGWAQSKTYMASGWMEWIFPGLYYLGRTPNHGVPISPAIQTIIDDMCDQWDADVGVVASLDSREWMAVTQR